MLSPLKLYTTVGILLALLGYYQYTSYTMEKQSKAIQALEVKQQLTTENGKVKDVQHSLDVIKEVHDARKDVKTDVNLSTGHHTISF